MISSKSIKFVLVAISLLSLVSCVVHSHPPHKGARGHKVALKKRNAVRVISIKTPDQKVYWNGHWYFVHQGFFFKKEQHGYIRVSPPIGLTVKVLPRQFVRVKLNGQWRYNYSGVHFRWNNVDKSYVVIKVN